MTGVEILIITIWAIGSVVAVGGSLTMLFLTRPKWKKLPTLPVEMTGPGPEPEEVERAIDFFRDRWPEIFSVSGLRIEWVKGEWFKVWGDKAAGASLNRDYVKLANAHPIRALFHELVHICKWRNTGAPDRDHLDKQGWDNLYQIQLAWENQFLPDEKKRIVKRIES